MKVEKFPPFCKFEWICACCAMVEREAVSSDLKSEKTSKCMLGTFHTM